MKKLTSAILFLTLLLLAMSACQTPAADAPPAEPSATLSAEPISPPPSQPPAADPLPAESEPEAEPEIELPAEEEDEDLFLPANGISFPDFLVHFDFDRADWLDVNAYRDYAICLLGEEECNTLKEVLDPTSWTVAAEIPAMGLEPAYILYDHAGNSLVVTPWETEYCLIIAADHNPEGDVHRYFAPNYVLDGFNEFLAGLIPLPGTVSSSEEYYYHLFREDAGIEPLIAMATPDGSISDEQIRLHALAQASVYESAGLTEEELSLRHFGRPLPDTAIPATDFHFGSFLVLEEESMDEDGTITALFQCYNLSDDVWLDELIDAKILNHIKEYLLTGNDEAFPEPIPLEIVFEIHFDIPTQTSYIYYHSVKVLPQRIEDAATAYQAVLNDELALIDGSGSVTSLHNYAAALYASNYAPDYARPACFTAFTRCDLDGDGVPEVILSDATNDGAYAGTTVLRWQEGTVYAHHFPYRGFYDLKADGTFHFSSGASDCGIASITFDKTAYTIEKISYCASELSESGELIVRYFLNGQETTDTEFAAAMAEPADKAEPVWYEFTPENLAAAFAN